MTTSIAAALAALPDVMKKKQAADALGVDCRTLDRWAASGRIRKIKPAGSGKTSAVRFLKADLIALLERGAA
jgi:excisionase family DNA binding protein